MNEAVPSKLPVIPPDSNRNEPVSSVSPITCSSIIALLDNINDPVIR